MSYARENASKPSLFIGSSSEGLEIARAVEFNLQHDAEVTLWTGGVFGLSIGNLESLVNALDRFDFAVLVITPDDVVTSRDVVSQAPRDNVMFEMGLFMGRLGRERTFAVCSDSKDMRLPSDLAGVSLAVYDAERAKREAIAAVSPACTLIRQSLGRLGVSETRGFTRLNQATSQVEGISESVASLVNLLAQSRIMELEVISASGLGMLLPEASMQQLVKDLKNLRDGAQKGKETHA